MRLLSLLALASLALPLRAQTAGFTASPTSGCIPLIVQFSNTSTGNITSYFWDFGNGSTSVLANPSNAYTQPGVFSCTLIVQGPGGPDTLIRTQYIEAKAPPSPAFSFQPAAGCHPLLVNFQDQSTPGSASISAWFWDFGDGTNSTQQHPTHTYTSPGTYSVSLQVTDNAGCTDFVLQNGIIRVHPPPTAQMSFAPAFACTIPAQINFTNSSSGTTTSTWDFGDGNSSSQHSPIHAYNAYGTFYPRLIATDSNGCKDTLTSTTPVSVYQKAPKMVLPKKNGCVFPTIDTFHFIDSSLGATIHRWDFGNGVTDSGQHVTYQYQLAGVYPVRLITGVPGCLDTIIDSIRVQQITAVIGGGPFVACDPPLTVNFLGQGQNAVHFKWKFPAGFGSSSLQNPTVTFPNAGAYQINLTTTDSFGCQAFAPFKVVTISTITGQPFGIKLGCVGDLIDFQHSLQGMFDPIVSWDWDFGDGNTSTQSQPKHTYTDTGNHTVQLIITTQGGCKDTFNNIASIGYKDSAQFFLDRHVACAGSLVGVHATGVKHTVEWSYSDGGKSSGIKSGHGFCDTGWFHVTATARHFGCFSKPVRLDDSVRIIGPVAIAGLLPIDCSDPTKRSFIDTSIGNRHKWHWDFGDGHSDTVQHPVHSYPGRGDYVLVFTVTDTVLGCTISKVDTVKVRKAEAVIEQSDTLGCIPMHGIDFDGASSVDAGTRLDWDFGNGLTMNRQNTSPWSRLLNPSNIVYGTSGRYHIRLIATDMFGCSDTAHSVVQVFYHEAAIHQSTFSQCAPDSFHFEEVGPSDSTKTQWYWDFGNGQTTTGNPAVTHYDTAGNFTIQVISTDIVGCTDTIDLSLRLHRPRAEFVADSILCPHDTVNILNTSKGNAVLYEWDFGNGDTMQAHAPFYLYPARQDTFQIRLMITDSFGCQDSAWQPVRMYETVGGVILSDTSKPCPPFLVNFSDSSATNVIAWDWDFGDQSGSKQQNPAHQYTEPGWYSVRLAVQTAQGCVDTVRVDSAIRLGGPRGRITFGPNTGCAPLKVCFVADSLYDVAQIQWLTDDGGLAFGDSACYVYENYGTFYPIAVLDNGKTGNQHCQTVIGPGDSIYIETLAAGIALSDSVLCSPGILTVTDTSLGQITYRMWAFNGVPNSGLIQTYDLDTSGAYHIQLAVASASGCTDTASMIVHQADSIDVIISRDSLICPGDPVLLQSVVSDTVVAYHWDGSALSSTAGATATASPLLTSTYVLTVTDTLGCSWESNEVMISTLPPISILVSEDTTIYRGGTAELRSQTSGPAYPVFWSGATPIACDTCASIAVQPEATITMTATVTDTLGCMTVSDEVVVQVIQEAEVYYPSAITPNGDGQNDVFVLSGHGIKELEELLIFNRWGQVIFSSSDLLEGWDGTFNNQPVPLEVYVFYARVRSIEGRLELIKGNVTVLR